MHITIVVGSGLFFYLIILCRPPNFQNLSRNYKNFWIVVLLDLVYRRGETLVLFVKKEDGR
jgi:hypothetical protein